MFISKKGTQLTNENFFGTSGTLQCYAKLSSPILRLGCFAKLERSMSGMRMAKQPCTMQLVKENMMLSEHYVNIKQMLVQVIKMDIQH